jgi:prepilin-type N-terminal cleavage/methylation domain-containing protein
MRARRTQRGFTLVELLVSQAVVLLAMAAGATLLVQNAKINKSQQLTLAVQADARNSLSLVANALRTAGWDPVNANFNALGLDPDPNGAGNYIEIYSDLNGDGDTNDQDEAITVEHTGSQLRWRKVADPSQPFVVLADGITNDQNGDGVIEPMFTPDSMTSPHQITIRITARSPEPDPRTRQFIRYTAVSTVYLRGT